MFTVFQEKHPGGLHRLRGQREAGRQRHQELRQFSRATKCRVYIRGSVQNCWKIIKFEISLHCQLDLRGILNLDVQTKTGFGSELFLYTDPDVLHRIYIDRQKSGFTYISYFLVYVINMIISNINYELKLNLF